MANKICKYCREEIDPKAKICPHCRKKQSGLGDAFKCVIVALAILIFGPAFIGACTKASRSHTDNTSQITTNAPKVTEATEETKAVAEQTEVKKELVETEPQTIEQPTEQVTQAPEVIPEVQPEQKQEPAPADDMTLGQKNAIKSAQSYLGFMAFSASGLIDQLEYEGYSHEDAVFAVERCGADWNEQAAKAAKSYLDMMAFSRDSLIDQLIYEGFTAEQAEYGASAVGY